MVKNFSCIKNFDNVKKQKIYEALIMLKERPSINKQNEDFCKCFKIVLLVQFPMFKSYRIYILKYVS